MDSQWHKRRHVCKIYQQLAKPEASSIEAWKMYTALADSLHLFAAMHQDMSQLIQPIAFLSVYQTP